VLVYRSDERDLRSFFVVDSFADRVVDAMGTGDALLAYATLTQMATGSAVAAAVLGTFAAAIECERDGNLPVFPEEVLEKLGRIESRALFAT